MCFPIFASPNMGWSVGLSPAELHGSTGWITDHMMPSREVAMQMHALNVCSIGKNATNVSDRIGLTCAAKKYTFPAWWS